MTDLFTEDFGNYATAGDTITATAGPFTLTATLRHDDNPTPPWEREDGHGPVSDWQRGNSKAPGERVLSRDGNGITTGNARFYDFAEAVRLARRDGWGLPEGLRRPGMTKREIAAEAARLDFEALRTWCNDEWFYVGVAVTVECEGVRLTDEFAHALWGVDCNYPTPGRRNLYLREVANELATDALAAAREVAAQIANSTKEDA